MCEILGGDSAVPDMLRNQTVLSALRIDKEYTRTVKEM